MNLKCILGHKWETHLEPKNERLQCKNCKETAPLIDPITGRDYKTGKRAL